jgi:hypothetical protein
MLLIKGEYQVSVLIGKMFVNQNLIKSLKVNYLHNYRILIETSTNSNIKIKWLNINIIIINNS